MSLYTYIIDPENKLEYKYDTIQYKTILKKYINKYKSGGNLSLDKKNFLENIKKQDKTRQEKALQKRINRIKLSKKFKLKN